MAVDFDAKLTEHAAEILREAARVYDRDDVDAWLAGYNPMLAPWDWTTSFPSVTGSLPTVTASFRAASGASSASAGASQSVTGSFRAVTGAFRAVTGAFQSLASEPPAEPAVTLRRVFRLPRALPAIRIPPTGELASKARSAPTMTRLVTLAGWLGGNGRLVSDAGDLAEQDAADAARQAGVSRGYLPYLWEYALTSGWFELVDSADGSRAWALPGQAAWRWADGDDVGALHVWSVVFAAVLARALEVAASAEPQAARRLSFEGQGVAVAVSLFADRNRGSGLTVADIGELVRSGAVGSPSVSRARRAWGALARAHGDPTRALLGELAAMGAVSLPPGGEGVVGLTPLAQWALREQFTLDKISIPLLQQGTAELTAASLVTLAQAVSDTELDAEFATWLRARDADQAARELLSFAAFSGPQPRLAAINLVRKIGPAAQRAWRDAMQRPELRGYARIALSMMAADLPESTLPLVLDPGPDDLTWVATDLLALACGTDDPDPDEIAEQFAAAVPAGEEAWIFTLMTHSSHPDVTRILDVLAAYHPDRRVARNARKAARASRRARVPVRDSSH